MPVSLSTLAAYALQIGCIIAAATLALWMLPVPAPRVRYTWWRSVLAAALMVPWLAGILPVPAVDEGSEPIAIMTMTTLVVPGEPASDWPGRAWFTASSAIWIVAVGGIARLLWLVCGLARLRSLRRRGEPVPADHYRDIQDRTGTNAELRHVPGLAQPVTFGVRRPVVLLPERLFAMPESTRRAVLTHELLHVQRRDWAWVLIEEGLRAVFWFHPAIWWATSRIQRAREELVDHLAIRITGSRRAYMEALLAFTDTAPVRPAAAFVRQPHVFHRIVLLSQEAAMSSGRLVISSGALIAVLVAAAWFGSGAFPLNAATPGEAQTAGPGSVHSVTPENPIPRRVYSVPIQYPQELKDSGLSAAVEVRVVLDAGGAVSSVTRAAVAVSAGGNAVLDRRQVMEQFVAAARDAIRQWVYESPLQAPLAFYVAVTFRPGAEAIVSQSGSGRGVVTGGREGARVATPADLSASGGTLREATRAARRQGQRTAATGQALRIGGNIQPPVKIKDVQPIYPDAAQAAKIQGVVILETLIDEQGRVADVSVLRSIPELDQAAIDAVRQWEFTPTMLNGKPVPVIMTITVQFTLT